MCVREHDGVNAHLHACSSSCPWLVDVAMNHGCATVVFVFMHACELECKKMVVAWVPMLVNANDGRGMHARARECE